MARLTPIYHGSARWPHLGGANELPLFWFSNWCVTWNVATLSLLPIPFWAFFSQCLKNKAQRQRGKRSPVFHMRALPCVSTLNELLIYSEREKKGGSRGKKKKIRRIKLGFNCCCPPPAPRPSNTNSNRAAQLTALEVISTFFPRQLQNSVLK